MGTHYREFHGVRVADPFHWLENTRDACVQDWVRAQEMRTDEFLRRCSELSRCRELLDHNHPDLAPDWSCVRGTRVFRLVRRAGAAQPLLVASEDGGPERVLIDPNPLGKVLPPDPLSVSPSGRYLAYALAPPAGQPSTMHVVDVASGRVLEESRCTTALPIFGWHPDERGFFCSLFRRLFDDDGSGDARQDGLRRGRRPHRLAAGVHAPRARRGDRLPAPGAGASRRR